MSERFPLRAPPLWKAILWYYGALLAIFAVLGVVGTDGNPVGILGGLAIVVLAHLAPVISPPPGTGLVAPAAVGILVAGIWWLQSKVPPWWRIALVVGALFAWFYTGGVIMGHWT